MVDASNIAVITGAARGIGLATARAFLANGWRVALMDIDEPQLTLAANELAAGDNVLTIACDVAEPDQVATAAAKVEERFGCARAVVNNAGIAVFKPLLEHSYEEWSRVLAVNLTGPFLMVQAFAPLLIAAGGGAGAMAPASVAVSQLARAPANIALTPILARSPRREGAMLLMPPTWIAIEAKLAKPHRA